METTPQERGVIEAGMACAWVTLGYETMHVARIVIACRAVSRCEWWTVGKQGQSVTLHQRSREIQLGAGFGASRASEGLGTTCYLLLRLLAAILIHVQDLGFVSNERQGCRCRWDGQVSMGIKRSSNDVPCLTLKLREQMNSATRRWLQMVLAENHNSSSRIEYCTSN